MEILTTSELKIYIENLFDKLRPFKEEKSCYALFDIKFSEGTKMSGDFCYSDGQHYYYGGMDDRGKVTSEEFDNLFDLTYAIFEFQTQGLAFDYARNHRVAQHDPRRIAFPRQIELIRIIGEEYAQKLEQEIEGILKEYPYRD